MKTPPTAGRATWRASWWRLVSTALLVGWRGDNPTRLGFWGPFLGVLPSIVLMRVAGQWTESREFGDVEDVPGWIDVGYVTSDLGALLLLICLVLAGVGLWRGGRVIGRIVAVATALLLLAYVVAVWAMTTKPG